MGAFPGILRASNAPAFTRGAGMDAVALVDGIYRLIGTTTGATIALLKCRTVGPVTYELIGRLNLWQADGDEFTGVFKFANQAPATHTWGVAGSRTTGGLINGGNGAQFLEGLVPVRGVHHTISAQIMLVTLNLTAGNGAWIGTTRSAALTAFSGGGLGVNATPLYGGATFVAKDLAAPTLAVNTAYVGAPSTVAEQTLWTNFEASVAGSATRIVKAGCLESDGQQQLSSTTTLADAASTNDRIPCISGRTITFRVIDFEVMGQT